MSTTDKEHKVLSDEQIDAIASDGMRNAIGGIYATSVHDFARAIEAASRAPLLERIAALEAELAGVREKAARWQQFALGGWAIEHCPPASFLTDEANTESAFRVKRVLPPFCTPMGARDWLGPTPEAALSIAIDAMRTGEKP